MLKVHAIVHKLKEDGKRMNGEPSRGVVQPQLKREAIQLQLL